MEQIIKKALEGGFKNYKLIGFGSTTSTDISVSDKESCYKLFLDPTFFQALGKACGWGDITKDKDWLANALEFHELNLTEGWDKAVEYLTEITKK